MIKSETTAEDVLQKTLLSIALTINTDRFEYRGEKAFRGWIYTIARNKALTAINSASYHAGFRANVALEDMTDDFSGMSPTRQKDLTEVIVEERENIREFQEILAGLAPRQREALILQINGWSQEQIADFQGGTIASVKGLLMRARENISERLQDNNGLAAADVLAEVGDRAHDGSGDQTDAGA